MAASKVGSKGKPKVERLTVKGFEERFSQVKFLGSGGNGQVFKAYNKERKKFVALKFLTSASLSITETRALQEFEIVKKIRSPIIIKYFSVFRTQVPPRLRKLIRCPKLMVVIEMEYMKGYDLLKVGECLFHTGYKLSQKEVCMFIRKMAKGIALIHSNDMAHRDIKLENVFVSEKGLKLFDFDFACYTKNKKVETDFQCGRDALGTPVYYSPEIRTAISQKKSNPSLSCQASDIWAFAIMICELTVGEPFSGEYFPGILELVKFKKKLPLYLKDLVNRMTVVDWKKRATIDEVIKMVEEICPPVTKDRSGEAIRF